MHKNVLLAALVTGCLSVSTSAEQAPPASRPTAIEPAAKPAREKVKSIRLEKCAYLGVATSPAPQALRQQVELPAGIGLVIDAVAPDSPAVTAGLKKHDLLHKINDQLLVNPQQLAVLVRTFKSGEGVKLTVIRAGKPIEVSATLVEKELPPLDELRFGFEDPLRLMDERFEQLRDRSGLPPRENEDEGAPQQPRGLLNDSHVLTWRDADMTLSVTVHNGRKTLVAKNEAGKELFNGPIDTDSERAALPANVRGALDRFGPPGK